MSMEEVLPVLVVLAKCVFAVAFVMQIVPLLIWAERKGSAYIQDRPGPNRAHILGIRAGGHGHSLTDVVKLIMKEDIIPGHVHLQEFGRVVKEAVRAAGGVPFEFNTIGVDDGIAMGHVGMKFSLPSRELIADCVETMMEAHRFDGMAGGIGDRAPTRRQSRA